MNDPPIIISSHLQLQKIIDMATDDSNSTIDTSSEQHDNDISNTQRNPNDKNNYKHTQARKQTKTTNRINPGQAHRSNTQRQANSSSGSRKCPAPRDTKDLPPKKIKDQSSTHRTQQQSNLTTH